MNVKFVKGISLFFIYSLFFLCLGFYAGVRLSYFFDSGERPSLESPPVQGNPAAENGPERAEAGGKPSAPADQNPAQEDSALVQDLLDQASQAVAAIPETLSVETEYVLQERDLEGNTTVETTWRLPDKYVGMNRDQFLLAMEIYEAAPPLSERERGFVSLEVLSFSRERVVVQMNYRYVLPSSSFYLGVYDNMVIVYLDDRETVYIETDIQPDQLPEEMRRELVDMIWIEDEAALFDFLEAYSS